MSHPQRLPYIDPASITDPLMLAEFERAPAAASLK
jgi:hypothetical protein